VLVQNAQIIPNVQFIGVVFNDTEDKINAFLRERGSVYPTLLDEQGKTAIAYGVGGVPETYFLNRQGVIVAKFTGPMTTEILQSNVAKALQ
jgi:cytochrome c biogenesis protein CcmG/thiol:disulfide interchange protein DsbE